MNTFHISPVHLDQDLESLHLDFALQQEKPDGTCIFLHFCKKLQRQNQVQTFQVLNQMDRAIV